MTSPDTAGAVIETQDLCRRYGRKQVLFDVNLRVRGGEIFGLLGPDGAGKTTLMQIMAGILDPSSGRCAVMGHDTVRQAYWVNSHVGYMFQGFTLYDKLSVSENMAFSADVRGLSREVFRERQERLLRMAGLLRFLDRPAGKLSGGMRKKLSLCTNLIHEPRLLLLDELSLGVDPASRRELWDMLHASRDQGVTVVVTTPYMDEAGHCDRLAFLHEGRVLAVDQADGLLRACAGHVVEWWGEDRAGAHDVLHAHPDTVGIRHLADRIRFQTRVAMTDDHDLVQALRARGRTEHAAPALDDAYIMLSGGEDSAAFAPPPPSISLSDRPPERGRVRTEALTVRYGDFVANDAVTLDIAPGEIFGFLGANGAGKTTFIKTLCGLQRPTSGQGWIGGVSVHDEPERLRRHIGYMSQRFSLYPDLTVQENLDFFAGVYGLSRPDRRAAIAWALEATDLKDVRGQLVSAMSGALNQRLALACAIMHQPSAVFLDEPTSGVSPSARYKFWQLIQTLSGGGTTIFVTTHYLEEASYCHRLGMMHQGRLIGLGTAETLAAELPPDVPRDSIEDIFLAFIAREDARREARAA